MDYARATRIAASIGQGMAFLFGAAGFFGNPMLILIAFFVWIGAAHEAAAAQMKSGLAGCLVRDAMQSKVRTLSPQDTLRDGVSALLAGAQQDFPVLENGRVVGMLGRHDLLKGIHEHGELASVASAMQREVEVLDANELLDWAVTRMDPERGLSRPVLRDGHLVGLLTAENLGEFFMIRAALERRRRCKPPKLPLNRVPPMIPRLALAKPGPTPVNS
jgi:CBS domain-containing protein